MFNKMKLVGITSILCLSSIAYANDNLNDKLDRLLDNQKVILTRLQKLEKNQNELAKKVNSGGAKKPNKPQVDYNKEYKVPVGNSIVLGNPSAKVTITEWMDFQ